MHMVTCHRNNNTRVGTRWCEHLTATLGTRCVGMCRNAVTIQSAKHEKPHVGMHIIAHAHHRVVVVLPFLFRFALK